MSEDEADAPAMIDADTAARQIWDLYRRTNGATFSLFWGDLSGRDLYAVSADPNRVQVLDSAKVSVDIIADFIRANMDLLSDAEKAVGVWLEVEDDQTYLDVSVTLADHDRVLEVGREHGEIAICYLADLTVEYIQYD